MPYLPLQLPAFLAELAGRLSTSYYHREYALVTDAYEAMSHGLTSRNSLYFDSRFTALPEYQPGGTGARRRRPTPFEAVVETARRLRDLNTLEDSLRGTDCGALLGGSCSYGRFFNIVGQSEGSASDLDLLIVAPDNDALREIVLSALAGFALDTSAVASSKARLRDYLDYSTPTKSEFVVFSHKVPLWTRNDDPLLADINIDASYNLSLHLMPQLVADQIMLADVPLITTASAGSERYVTDFRETPAARTDHQRSFSGKNIRIPLREDGFRDSYARRTVAFKIGDGDQYFPGMFQNLILPLFDVRWVRRVFVGRLTPSGGKWLSGCVTSVGSDPTIFYASVCRTRDVPSLLRTSFAAWMGVRICHDRASRLHSCPFQPSAFEPYRASSYSSTWYTIITDARVCFWSD